MSGALLVKEVIVKGKSRWRAQRTVHGQHHSLGTFDEEKLAYESLQRKWPPEKDAKTAREERKNKVRAGNYWGALGEAPKRLWKGVTFEPDRKKWKVQPSGPRFDDQKEAAECYAEKHLHAQEHRT